MKRMDKPRLWSVLASFGTWCLTLGLVFMLLLPQGMRALQGAQLQPGWIVWMLLSCCVGLLGMTGTSMLLGRAFQPGQMDGFAKEAWQHCKAVLKTFAVMLVAGVLLGIINGLVALLLAQSMGQSAQAKYVIDLVSGIAAAVLWMWMLYLHPAVVQENSIRKAMKSAWRATKKRQGITLLMVGGGWGLGLLLRVLLARMQAEGHLLILGFGDIAGGMLLSIGAGLLLCFGWAFYHESINVPAQA